MRARALLYFLLCHYAMLRSRCRCAFTRREFDTARRCAITLVAGAFADRPATALHEDAHFRAVSLCASAISAMPCLFSLRVAAMLWRRELMRAMPSVTDRADAMPRPAVALPYCCRYAR